MSSWVTKWLRGPDLAGVPSYGNPGVTKNDYETSNQLLPGLEYSIQQFYRAHHCQTWSQRQGE